MGSIDEATRGIKTEEFGGDASVAAKEGAGDDTVEANAMGEGPHACACLKEGGEDGGVDLDAIVDGGLELGKDVVEGLFAGEAKWGWRDEQRRRRGLGVREGVKVPAFQGVLFFGFLRAGLRFERNAEQ